MSVRTILVPLLGCEEDRTALDAGLAVADVFGARIEVLFMTPDPKDSVLVLGDGLSTLVLEEILEAVETVRSSHHRTAHQAFLAALAEAGRSADAGIRWREVVGRIDELVAAEGRLADLTVLARSAATYDARRHELLEAALLTTGRPVLLVPGRLEAVGRVVALAWNGTLEASRAVAAALPWLHRAERVHIITIATSSTAAGDAGRLASYLDLHGIKASIAPAEPDDGKPVGAAILRQSAALNADLLVMGAYGHNRLREMILGGVTHHILTHQGPAVLMIH